MSKSVNPAQELLAFCKRTDAGTEELIGVHLRKLAAEIHSRQIEILEHMKMYREGLVKCHNPSADEFYDLFHLMTDSENKFSFEPNTPYLNEKMFSEWCARKSVPSLPARRHIMLAMFDSYLEYRVFSGLGRLSQTLHHSFGGDLFPGDHSLPVRQIPSAVTFLELTERWRVANVILPNGLDWYDRPCNVKVMSEHSSYEVIQDFVSDLIMVDIIIPQGCNPHSSLHSRLQKIPGVGARKAKEIYVWLESVGCQIEN